MPAQVINKRADRILKQAYSDTFKLLSTLNDCSRFYGGPEVALTVLNEFFRKMRKEKMPENVTFTMSGKTIYVLNLEVRAQFRMFEQTVVNDSGSFYIRNGPMGIRIPNVGSFLPATRSARALTLLHELGHLIRSPSGEWLLEDDGNDFERSRRNTDRVEKVCNRQLKRLQ
jgi:Zn-dependent peptidase ImmA (M78 family)